MRSNWILQSELKWQKKFKLTRLLYINLKERAKNKKSIEYKIPCRCFSYPKANVEKKKKLFFLRRLYLILPEGLRKCCKRKIKINLNKFSELKTSAYTVKIWSDFVVDCLADWRLYIRSVLAIWRLVLLMLYVCHSHTTQEFFGILSCLNYKQKIKKWDRREGERERERPIIDILNRAVLTKIPMQKRIRQKIIFMWNIII